MAMTEEERKEARRLAAKKWYETHCKAKRAVRKAKEAGVKPKRPGVVKTSGRKSGDDKAKAAFEKRVAKLALKGGKAAVAMKALIKEAAAVVTDAHKTGNEKLIDSVMSKLTRAMCLGISPVENGKGVLSSTLQAAFRVLKAKTVEKPAPGPDVFEAEPEDEDRSAEIPVGDANDVETASEDAGGLGFDDSYDEDPDDDKDDDEDDETEVDDEDNERDYARGREDMFREMGEMGVGEEDM